MKNHNPLHPFLLTIPALLALACDPPEDLIEENDDSAEATARGAREVAASAPADAANPEGYEVDEDDFPPTAAHLARSRANEAPSAGPPGAAARAEGPDDVAAPAKLVAGTATIGPDENLLVALVGDMGSGSKPRSVYKLILDEKADFAIITGDFDYKNSPSTFEKDANAVLGAEYPLFPTIGNHDTKKWKQYQAGFKARLAKIEGAVCTGDLGVDASCTYRGLHFVLSGVGTTGSDEAHEEFIAEALAADQSPWSLCVWHKNQTAFQAGDKPSDVGWTAFQHCQKDGAIVVMGHEHSYARTRTLTAIGSGDHGATGMPELLEVGPGRTFSVVSGLGGKGIRAWEAKLHKSDTWWGTLYTSDYHRKNGVEMKKSAADQGALFIRFNVDGDPSAAQGYFKTVDGDVIDEFDIVHQ